MGNFQLESYGDLLKGLEETIRGALEKEAYPAFRQYAHDVAEEAISARKDEPYTVAIDGKIAAGLSSIGGARKEVLIHFTQAAVRIAVKEFANILKGEAQAKAVEWKNVPNDIPAGVKVFHWVAARKDMVEITNIGEIETFLPGDSIWVTSSSPWQMYLNTMTVDGTHRVHPGRGAIKHGSGGFFGAAAKKIRLKLRAGPSRKGRTALWVGAARSRGILKHIGMPDLKTPEGRANWHHLSFWGAWGIMIKYSSRAGFLGD